MAEKAATTEEQLKEAAKRAVSGENLVTDTEIPEEYAAFRNLLRKVVKPEQKRVSAPVPADTD